MTPVGDLEPVRAGFDMVLPDCQRGTFTVVVAHVHHRDHGDMSHEP